jgi:hypothetical protein
MGVPMDERPMPERFLSGRSKTVAEVCRGCHIDNLAQSDSNVPRTTFLLEFLISVAITTSNNLAVHKNEGMWHAVVYLSETNVCERLYFLFLEGSR